MNCKINENSVFSKPEFKQLFQPYRLVQLYTDVVPNEFYAPALRAQFGDDITRPMQDAVTNQWFEAEAFGTQQLPLYVILEPLPDGTVAILGQYDEGKINNEAAFAQFLREPFEGKSAEPRAQTGQGGAAAAGSVRATRNPMYAAR